MPDTCSGVRQCGTGKSTDNLNRENKMNEKSFPKQECGGELFFLSQEIASCERKSLRPDAQLAEKNPARARNKSCAAKAVVRGGTKHTFVLSDVRWMLTSVHNGSR